MKILITGVSGFIGSSITDYILNFSNNYLVYGVFRNKNRVSSDIILHPNFFPIHSSIEDLSSDSFKGIDLVIHCAGPAASSKFKSKMEIVESLVNPTIHLLNILKSSKKNISFYYLSSGAVYGEGCPKNGFSETDSLRLDNSSDLYSSGKIYCESLLTYYSNYFPIVSLRLFSFFGKGMNSNFPYAICEFIHKSLNNIDIDILSKNNLRNYLDLRDLNKYIVRLFDLKFGIGVKSGLEVLNIGSQNTKSVQELAEKTVLLMNSKSQIICKNNHKTIRKNYFPNLNKLNNLVKIKETIFEDSLLYTINKFKYLYD